MSSPSSAGVGFRRDIQGLRAVAVLLVALAHADFGPFASGYIGVDVFFVISGFLITGLLLAEVRRTGSLSLAGFYARRARRILPAATVVVFATVVASAALLSRVDAAGVTVDAVWATLFLANVHFGREGTDYFAEGTPPSLLQHYWSLSVEEQFYLGWPLLLLLVALLARRRARAGRSKGEDSGGGDRTVLPAVVVLGIVVVASWTLSVVLTAADPVGAYFNTGVRIWELGVGALAATAVSWARRRSPTVRSAASWLGLAAVAWSAVFIPASAFPGWVATVPVVGTALLLLGGTGPTRVGPQRLLTMAPLRLVGDWSYSFYLWHWPALVLADRLGARPEGLRGLGVLAVALALSGLTYRFVENPFRRPRARQGHHARTGHRAGLVAYPVAIGLSVALALGTNAWLRSDPRSGGPDTAITLADYGQAQSPAPRSLDPDPAVALVQASVLAARNGFPVPGGLEPDLFELKASIPGIGGCDYYTWPNPQLCRLGDPDADRVLVLIGDSHARAWVPALEELAITHGYAAYYLVKEGCTPADIMVWQLSQERAGTGCSQFRSWAVEQIRALAPELVVVATDAPRAVQLPDGRVTREQREIARELERGTTLTLDRLEELAERVVLIGDVPGLEELPALCLSERDASLLDCASPPVSRARLMRQATRLAAEAAEVRFVDPLRWFCAYGLCPAVVGRTVTLRDREHISVDYARMLAEPLGAEIGLAADEGAREAGSSLGAGDPAVRGSPPTTP